MKKRILSTLCAVALCLSLLMTGVSVMAAESGEYIYTMLQDFESANAGSDCYTTGQFTGTNVLSYENVKNGKMVEVTVSDQTSGDHFYPFLSTADWTGYDGLLFYYDGTNCTATPNSLEFGRFDINIDMTSGTRYTATNTVGAMYFLEDGTTAETTLLVGGDNRYIMPNKAGYIRMPFASLNGWSESADMSSVREMFLWIATDSCYAGNAYRFDDFKLYKDGDSNYTVLQSFSSADIRSDCQTFSQHSGTNVLTYASVGADAAVSGSQYSKVTITKVDGAGDDFYPVVTNTDWSGQEGIIFYYDGTAATATPNSYEFSRFDIAIDVTGAGRLTASNNVGPIYFLENGTAAETTLLAGGDQRYLMPNKAGYIRVPFTSLAGWSESVDMSNVTQIKLWIAADSYYTGNVFYFDAFQLYTTAAPACEHEYFYPCDKVCMICYEETNPDAAHTIVHVDAVAATCEANGNIEYWYCSDCGACWADEALTQVTNQMSVIIPAAHSYFYPCDKVCMICYEETNPDAAHTIVDGACANCGLSAEWTEANGKTFFLLGGEKVKGLVKIDGEYYFFNTGSGKLMKDTTIWVASSNAYGLEAGAYVLGADGKLELSKNGFVTTGDGKTFYYADGEKLLGFQEIDGAIYYFNKGNGVMQKNCNVWVPSSNELGLAAGNYTLGADGKLELTGFVNPTAGRVFYRDNGELVKGLYVIDGQYYFFNTGSGAMVTDTTIFVSANELGLARGTYTVGADGVIIL